MPMVSFLTPTFNNPGLLRRALQSLQAQSRTDWELVISPDDGQDYGALAATDRRVRLVDAGGIFRSGPGPARTRALRAASGDFVACLDDDDTLAPDFVEVVGLALAASPVVTVPSTYVSEDGQVVREIGKDSAFIDIPRFADQYGSMQTIGPRAQTQPWSQVFAEDVLHTCQAIDAQGGRLPVAAATTCFITLRPGSLCATADGIDEAYLRLARSEFPAMSAAGAKATRALFRQRLEMSRRFEQRETRSIGYHEFVRESQRLSLL